MASGKDFNATDYIQHHLTFLTKPVGEGGFWALNIDSVITAAILGVLALGIVWWIVRGATSGVPDRRQAFVELAFEFVDEQVRGIFHQGDRNRFVAPAALTVFVWVLLMNAMDFLPVDIMAWMLENVFHAHEFRLVPTADVNTTFALALSVWLLMIWFSIAAKGLGGWIHELLCAPFGVKPLWASPLLVFFNLLFNFIEYVSKPLSHSLRLFGNMYAGEIIFLLLWLLAATGIFGTVLAAVLGLGWAIFHILIVVLQAYIFMMLTVVYIAMAHEHH
ncbi:MAG: F0F1 ATP synthase subunit A [Betaproteobacteria bacterium RIFCSPLOWO2_02_67_12]|nr:MAG: F0F1 ATP synthase subunit A [Betaproteobacteria bacterium RIFCSPLOWO2_02_67_12]OGA30678.1 MAG: F0F1 ATP synthase subunit A [Betaproteobacteria bacterium RIFCSPLOWO2_02_FULL_68_150]